MTTTTPTALILPLCLALAACAGPTRTPQAHDPHAVQVGQPGDAACIATSAAENQRIAARTNAARSLAGLPPVQSNSLLAEVAARHACDMAARGRMTHIGSTTSGPGDRLRAQGYRPAISAENIAAGPFSLERVLHEWTISSGHLANMMLPQIREVGIGQAVAADGRTRYWTAVYSAPSQNRGQRH